MNPLDDPTRLPDGLPVPIDDGGCDHLSGRVIPSLVLRATSGEALVLSETVRAPTVLFFYPRTGIPSEPAALGDAGEAWDAIPGARGCTPQSCAFRDLFSDFVALGVRVFGVSTNTTDHQSEFKTRVHLPFELLSDSDLALTRALRLPTFEFPVATGGPTTLLRRMAWYCDGGRIAKVWYPVFPPDQNAARVLDWLKRRP